MDIIYIRGLRVDAVIGIYNWERHTRQTLIIDLELAMDNRRAAASDDIADALNYKSIKKRLLQFVNDSSFHLVETLAESMAELIMKEFSVPWLRLRLNKQGALRHVQDVGVIIEREQRS